MADDEPRRRGPAWGRLLAESVLIVLSILLALGADAWREGRIESERREAALDNVRAEIEANIAALASVLPYHVEVLGRLGETVGADHGVAGFAVLAGVAPRGLQSPDIRRTAWLTALSSGVVASFDYDTIYALSGLYDMQEQGVMTTVGRITDMLFSTELHDPTRVGIALARIDALTRELVGQEEYLLGRSREVLAALAPAGPARPPRE
jgi:type II secretory pathway pseudopilin PulG